MNVVGRAVRRRSVVLFVATVLLGWLAVSYFSASAGSSSACERHVADSLRRAAVDTGSGTPLTVIGDSYSVGLGLEELEDSWPGRLDGRVHVAGFSGSGFSQGASPCRQASFADRAAGVDGAGLVIVQGGLNDFDQSDNAVVRGFDRTMAALAGHEVVVVGPPVAPARGTAAARLDGLLSSLAADHGVTYVPTSGLVLPYLPDRLHLTAEGHRIFGDHVAEAVRRTLG